MTRYITTIRTMDGKQRLVVYDNKRRGVMCNVPTEIHGNIIAAALNHCQKIPLDKLKHQ